jgi:hypothetical protein
LRGREFKEGEIREIAVVGCFAAPVICTSILGQWAASRFSQPFLVRLTK